MKAALDMIDMMQLLNADRLAQGKTEIRIGIGIASGVGDRRVYRHDPPGNLTPASVRRRPCLPPGKPYQGGRQTKSIPHPNAKPPSLPWGSV